jgi:hypothetical protein
MLLKLVYRWQHKSWKLWLYISQCTATVHELCWPIEHQESCMESVGSEWLRHASCSCLTFNRFHISTQDIYTALEHFDSVG